MRRQKCKWSETTNVLYCTTRFSEILSFSIHRKIYILLQYISKIKINLEVKSKQKMIGVRLSATVDHLVMQQASFSCRFCGELSFCVCLLCKVKFEINDWNLKFFSWGLKWAINLRPDQTKLNIYFFYYLLSLIT